MFIIWCFFVVVNIKFKFVTYVSVPLKKSRTPKKKGVIILKFNQCDYSLSNVSKKCRQNGKQCRR